MSSINAQQWSALMQMQLMQMQQIQFQQQQFMPKMQFNQQMQRDDKNENSPEETRTLFVANIDEKKVDEEMLFELFLQAGPIEKLSFPKQKPFCFVTYSHSCSPAYAMHLFKGVKLFGQNVVIKFNGTTNPPPLPRPLLPPYWGTEDVTMPGFNPFNTETPQRRNFDNSALRNSRLAAFMDNRNATENDGNNRRENRSPNRYSRDRGNNDNRRQDRHHDSNSDNNWTHGPDRRSRSHHTSGPYDRRGF